MRKNRGPFSAVVACVLRAATLCTLMMPDGWLVWIPVLLALATVGLACQVFHR